MKVGSERDIDKHKRRIREIEGDIEKIQNDIESITARQEADKKIIDDYLLIAGKQYMKYRESLEKKLDSREVSTEEKGILIIYLCLIEKDYQSILEMG